MKFILPSLAVCVLFCFGKCYVPGQSAAEHVADSIYSYKTATADGIGKYYFGREIMYIILIKP